MLRETLRFIWKYAGPFKWRVVLGLCAVFVTVQATAYVPNVVKETLDYLGRSPQTGVEQYLLWSALLVLVVAVIAAAGMFMMRRVLIDTSRDIEYRIRRDFFAHLETLSFRVYGRQRTGDLMSRATSDIEGVRMLVGPAVMHFSFTALLTPAVIVYMVDISPRLTVISFIPFVLVTIVVRIVAGRMYRLSLETQARLADVSNRAQENFSGIRVVKAFAQSGPESEQFAGASANSRDAQLRLSALRGLFQGLIHTLANLGVLAFVFFSPPEVIGGTLTFGDAIAFFAYQELLIWPMMAFGWTMALFQRGMASVRRLNEIFELESDVAPPAEPTPTPDPPRGAIEFRNVSFRYREEGLPVLRDVSFAVAPGQTVAFLGPIGAGKTTVARLIPRLMDPAEGQVLVDGVDLREWDTGRLRRAIGYAPQDSFLFSETIAFNIAFAIDDAGGHVDVTPERAQEIRDRIEAVGRLAQLDEDIRQFPSGYDQVIGERGVTLSGGQKQRVALARALMANPQILILDDSFSAVDTSTEERILDGLRNMPGSRTTLLIAHRVSTVRHADRIYVLKDGAITEQGTDAELMAAGGFYADIATRQRLQAEVEAL